MRFMSLFVSKLFGFFNWNNTNFGRFSRNNTNFKLFFNNTNFRAKFLQWVKVTGYQI